MYKAQSPDVKRLKAQAIDECGPGTILADFGVLLDFLGEEGVRSTGKYHLLPIARLAELDERMSLPLRPALKRPQQKSFPHLHAMYLLLRATELAVPVGQGKTTGRLVRVPEMVERWQALNPTEQYFNLLEAWLRLATWEVVGEREGWGSNLALRTRALWMVVPAGGKWFQEKRLRSEYSFYGFAGQATLAMLELFGLMEVRRNPPEEGENWRIEAVRRTPWGEALLPLLFDQCEVKLFDDLAPAAELGALQPALQRYYPEWRNNLEFPERKFRPGVYTITASLGSVWRRIAAPAEASLDDLAWCVIEAYEFDGDHLYQFTFVERNGRTVEVECPNVPDAQLFTDEVAIGDLPLDVGRSMRLHYDFGADWLFDIKLEQIDSENKKKITEPTLIASRGKAPPEYDFDDGEW